MNGRWLQVLEWLHALRQRPLPPLGLSPEGAALAQRGALDQLTDEVLERVAAMEGEAFPRARFVAARTVFTAPLEWVAVLLGRGTHVELQVPSEPSDVGTVWEGWEEEAFRAGLPLQVSSRARGMPAPTAPLVIAMGSDDGVQAVSEQVQERFLGFGARGSAAVCESQDDAVAIARDLAFFDSRGCMSPGLVLASDPSVIPWLVDAMREAEKRWPRGWVSDAEHAAIRSRAALARVLGRTFEGPGWSVHQLPPERARLESLPRSLLVVCPPDLDATLSALAADVRLSTLGTRREVEAGPGTRVVTPGTQQTPPVRRLHDGVDWLRATLRSDGAPGRIPGEEHHA